MRPGCVSLIGAGPGDPGLITVRGLRLLESADVVVYDHRVHARLLRAARKDAELIDVGPAAPQRLEQEAISLLLAEKAREGRRVARLKWGDPFVFDTGGKEAIFLHEHGIPFEVVPGILPAVAATGYAGVPLTYPGGGDVVTLVRGHESETEALPDVDWQRLAGVRGAIAVYVGARQLQAFVDHLLKGGRDPEDTAVLISQATTPDQVTVTGTVGAIVERARDAGIEFPAMLVIGGVVGLRDHLRWFDARPLFGRRMVITRSREQAAELVERLEGLGANPIVAPSIRIEPPESYEPLDREVAAVSTYDWVIFTSANGVDQFMARLLAGPGDLRDLKGVRICAIGPSTAARIEKRGIRVDLMPPEYRAEAVLEALKAHSDVKGLRFLLPRADLAREVLPHELRAAGAHVTEVTAYRTVLAESGGEPDVYRLLLDRRVDAIVFTSASTVRNFVKIIGAEPAADLLRTTVVACIGPVTAEAAQQLGIHTSVMPPTYTIPALVDALVDHFRQHVSRGPSERV